jgi:hypothetical protein
VVAIGDSVSRDVTRPVAEFRDRTLFAFDRRNVSAVDLDLDGSKMTIEPEDGGKWRIAKPGPYRGDAEMITEMLDKLASATVRVHRFAKCRHVRPRQAVARNALARQGQGPRQTLLWASRRRRRGLRQRRRGEVL